MTALLAGGAMAVIIPLAMLAFAIFIIVKFISLCRDISDIREMFSRLMGRLNNNNLGAPSALTAAAQAAANADKKFCRYCGEKYDSKQSYCPYCGKS